MGLREQSFETLYRDVLLQFERQQHALGRRGPLPCDMRPTYVPPPMMKTGKRKQEQRDKQRQILAHFKGDEILTASEVADVMGLHTSYVSNHMQSLYQQGVLGRERAGNFDKYSRAVKRTSMWAYWVKK